MKKITLLLCLLSTTFVGKGQNLVPNGDFEQYSGCPPYPGGLDSAVYWFNPTTTTPDYFNACALYYVGVPTNLFGFQAAHSGTAYCGIHRYSETHLWREYIEVQLTSPLIANTCYHFEMYINSGDSVKYTTDAIGVYFSDTLIISTDTVLPFLPQIENAAGNVPDTLNWTIVTGNYTANGGENYMIVGNFKDDNNTIVNIINNNTTHPNLVTDYVYIDDVSLTPCTAIEEHNQNEAFSIYPNPVKDELFIKSNTLTGKAEIIITDILGKEILRQQTNLKSKILNLQSFQSGIYFIEIKDGKNIYRKKFLKEK